MTLLTFRYFYWITGAVLAIVALRIALRRGQPRRGTTAAFWGVGAALYLGGDWLPPRVAGILVVAMVVVGLLRWVAPPSPRPVDRARRRASADRLGNRLFYLPLIVPSSALAGSLLLPHLHWGRWTAASTSSAGVISVALGAMVALALTLRATRESWACPIVEGGHILETFGWVLFLPQFLAALSVVLLQLGVGDWIGKEVAHVLPAGSPFLAVAGYCLAMAGFTMCLGNAFAAFAVITSGIGIPFIVQLHHGDPAIMAAIGMLSGYCGTLMTPVAANFNLVPALLLELPDRNAVVKAQVPMAVAVLAVNIIVMWLCVYRF